jgi:hypothetical protein
VADYTIDATDPRWKRFEKLVARIVATLSSDAVVTYDDKIPGKLSGVLRQIDVSIRAAKAEQSQLIIVQCRDYAKPLDVNDIGEFSSVIQDVGASKGVMVSVFGYAETAKHYARNLNIDVMRMIDAENTMWAEYFGLEPVTFRQVVYAPTLLVHRSLEVTFTFQSSRFRPRCSMPYNPHEGELLHADGSPAGTALDLVGDIWAEEGIPHQPLSALLKIEFAEPVCFAIDKSRTPICRLLLYAKVVERMYHGQWRVAQITGLANDVDETITARGLTLSPLDFDQVRANWNQVAPDEARQLRATVRLFSAGAWDINESVRLPTVTEIRSVTEAEFTAADSVCEASEQSGRQGLSEAPDE